MVLSVAKRRYIRRLAGYGTNPVRRRVREVFNREQTYTIGGVQVALPPGHDLPFYQRRDPTYDTYAQDLLRTLASDVEELLVIDLGANVGDTAVTALTSADNISVVAVEGNPKFVPFLRRNTVSFGDRCRTVDGFVGPVGEFSYYQSSATTGGFSDSGGGGSAVDAWISPTDLLADSEQFGRVVWKSDTDGFDFAIAVQHWDTIIGRCDSLWLEWDPASAIVDQDDVALLTELLSGTGHATRVFDNLGREMVHLPAGEPTRAGLQSLSHWLRTQRTSHLAVPYVDIWNCPW
ncbi:hypothetical protein [Ornithinimicrobium cryptoxanthini]|uniref:FkbM family methyltransferase n=1 Tax=Ornithinimicrobium cryptoxanthini TaxID=2934161 RepID=A0ABY4YKE1_9MICO|nr:hypothetical protein [Ornithinimicrobium cryptoxanthini]USQ76602.1 hypothetical protein NF557_01330 [Ornithinimicrobium cryptoxanthini]